MFYINSWAKKINSLLPPFAVARVSEVIIFRVALGGDLAWSRRVNRRERRLQNCAGNFESRYSEKLIAERLLSELRHTTLFIFHWFSGLGIDFAAGAGVVSARLAIGMLTGADFNCLTGREIALLPGLGLIERLAGYWFQTDS